MARFEDAFPPYHPFGSRTLSLQTPNLKGTDVAIAQAVYNLMLTAMNPPQGPMGSPVKVDGVFGPSTRTAVQNIQSYFGLATDGVMGPATYLAYGQGVGPDTPDGGPAYGSRSLSQGMQGGDVAVLQNRLNGFGYAALVGHPANGAFDAGTAQAVLAFKRDAVGNGDTGLSANAVVGDGTFDASWLYTFAGGRALDSGLAGFDVVFLQTVLQRLGYYSGAVQGYYDAATRAAVLAFQAANGLATDGVVGQATFFKIGQHNAVAAPSPLKVAWPVVGEEEPGQPQPFGYTDCATALAPLVVPGGSLWLRQGPGPEATIVVTGINLPSPGSFGSAYDRYWYAIQDEVSGQMAEVAGPFAMWQGVHQGSDVVLPFPPDATVLVQVGDQEEASGPVVLAGTVGSCTGG